MHSNTMRTGSCSGCHWMSVVGGGPLSKEETPWRETHWTQTPLEGDNPVGGKHGARQEVTRYTPVDRQTPVKTLPSFALRSVIILTISPTSSADDVTYNCSPTTSEKSIALFSLHFIEINMFRIIKFSLQETDAYIE